MGIKENFTQAVKELTGIAGKSKPEERAPLAEPVEELKKAVSDGNTFNSRDITLEPKQPLNLPGTDTSRQDPSDLDSADWEGYDMASTVRPMPKTPQPEQSTAETKPESTPKQDLFIEPLVPEQPAPELPKLEQPRAVEPISSEPASSPAADEFLSGGEVPVSLFGGQPQPQAQQTPRTTAPPFAREVTPVQPVPVQSTQPPAVIQPPFSPGGSARSQSFAPSQSYATAASVPRQFGKHDDNELTIISRNTFVDGNVRSFADMSIDGDVKGDVETTKNVDLNGKIVGNITCNNAMMHTSQIQGNVRMKGNVSMKRDTLLMGDLMSTYADINGKVKGNLDVVGKADLKGDAVVFGDISASTITVEDGAIIQGYVSTTFLNKEESKNLFPDTVTINEVGSAGA